MLYENLRYEDDTWHSTFGIYFMTPDTRVRTYDHTDAVEQLKQSVEWLPERVSEGWGVSRHDNECIIQL